ncbi:MAG: glutamyl-tRNA reductase [Planctomycetota bacterium]|jgi:glutamyl-tRNA reductase
MPSSEAPDAGGDAGGRGAIAVVGAGHRETPLALRERLSIPPGELGDLLRRVRAAEGVEEVVALSTCNRVELYLALAPAADGAPALAAEAFCDARGVRLDEVEPTLYVHRGTDAVRHLFGVACGLDSMVPGENEVFGQVKTAYAAAAQADAVGSELSRLFQRAFKVAKDVRSRTGIARRRVSIATVVVELAGKVFGDLRGAKVALVGAGEMAELALKALVSAGTPVEVVANRSMDAAEELASRHGGEAVGLDRVGEAALRADIVVASTSAPSFIVSADHVRAVVRARKGRPMLLVDLGVPRDVDPAASGLDGVILYDIDDLQGVVAENIAYRLEEADRAKAMVAEEVRKFSAVMDADDVAGTITRLCRELDLIGESESRRAHGRMGDLTEAQRRELDMMARRIVRKVLHSPIRALKESASDGAGDEMRRAVRWLFGL